MHTFDTCCQICQKPSGNSKLILRILSGKTVKKLVKTQGLLGISLSAQVLLRVLIRNLFHSCDLSKSNDSLIYIMHAR